MKDLIEDFMELILLAKADVIIAVTLLLASLVAAFSPDSVLRTLRLEDAVNANGAYVGGALILSACYCLVKLAPNLQWLREWYAARPARSRRQQWRGILHSLSAPERVFLDQFGVQQRICLPIVLLSYGERLIREGVVVIVEANETNPRLEIVDYCHEFLCLHPGLLKKPASGEALHFFREAWNRLRDEPPDWAWLFHLLRHLKLEDSPVLHRAFVEFLRKQESSTKVAREAEESRESFKIPPPDPMRTMDLEQEIRYPFQTIPIEGGRQILRLRKPLNLEVQSGALEFQVKDWDLKLPCSELVSLPREVARRFLFLFHKAENGELDSLELDSWLKILDFVDFQSFSIERSAPRYLEGKLLSRSNPTIVEWHDGTTARIDARIADALSEVNVGESFSGFVKLGENNQPAAIDRVSLLGVLNHKEDWREWPPGN